MVKKEEFVMHEENVIINHDKLKFCKHSGCEQQHKGPHQHVLKECKTHKFCELGSVSNVIDPEQSVSLPFLVKGK